MKCDDRWKACLAAGGGIKRRFQFCTDDSGAIVYFRSFQEHSVRNLIDPSLKNNVVIPSNFFQYIYHIECAFNLFSIIDSGLVPGSRNSNKRQTVFFLPVDPMDNNHKDPKEIDLNVPRHAHYLHNALKRHQDVVYWVDINLAIEKRSTFYQTRSNAIILEKTLPPYCIPKVVRMKNWRSLIQKVCMSPRPPPKIFLKHEGKRELGSDHDQRSDAEQPVLRRSMFILFAKNLVLQSDRGDLLRDHSGKTRSWDKCNPNTFIWRQKGLQRWTGTWANGTICHHAWRD